MKEYFVYILQCSDGSYYTGVTNNIEERFFQHQSGMDQSCYTFKRRPLKLVHVATFQTAMEAIEREKQIKRWGKKKKEALIAKDYEKLPELSECQNETHCKYKLCVPSLDSARDDEKEINARHTERSRSVTQKDYHSA